MVYLDADKQTYADLNVTGNVYGEQALCSLFLKAETKKGKEYVVLILLSDCGIVDQVETARLVIEASHLPLSLIILGMGDNDFQFMNVLDGDDRTLSFNGEKPARDVGGLWMSQQ